MTEENTDHTIALEGMKPENSDTINNNGLPEEETTEKIIEEREGEDVSQKSQILDDMIGPTSPSEVSDSAGPLMKNPNVVIVGPDHKFIVRSRYRRVSTGSCHDLCKFGHEHEPEKVKKRPFLGTIRESRPLVRTASGDIMAKSVIEKETKSKALLRRLSLPGLKSVKDPKIHTESTKSPKRITVTQSKMKRIQSEIKPSSVSTPGNSISRTKTDVPAVKKTLQVKSSQKVEEINTKEACSPSEKRKVKAKEPMSSSQRTQLENSSSIRATLYKKLKSFSCSRHQSNSEDAKIKKSRDLLEKAESMIKPIGNNTEKALKFSLSNEEAPSTQRESYVGKNKKSNDNKRGTRFGLLSFSSPSSSKSGSYTKEIGTVVEESGSKTNKSRAKTTVNLQTKAKTTGISHPEEKDGSAWKVKFRRGTVVNPQVANSSSRKLRFKRGRILGEDQNAKVEAEKSLKSKDNMTDELPDTNPEPEKVRLRRQETSGKKDSVDLNNVIEETASKLVKTRKSKVKALVGAFETVMSFNDREPVVEPSAS